MDTYIVVRNSADKSFASAYQRQWEACAAHTDLLQFPTTSGASILKRHSEPRPRSFCLTSTYRPTFAMSMPLQ